MTEMGLTPMSEMCQTLVLHQSTLPCDRCLITFAPTRINVSHYPHTNAHAISVSSPSHQTLNPHTNAHQMTISLPSHKLTRFPLPASPHLARGTCAFGYLRNHTDFFPHAHTEFDTCTDITLNKRETTQQIPYSQSQPSEPGLGCGCGCGSGSGSTSGCGDVVVRGFGCRTCVCVGV